MNYPPVFGPFHKLRINGWKMDGKWIDCDKYIVCQIPQENEQGGLFLSQYYTSVSTHNFIKIGHSR